MLAPSIPDASLFLIVAGPAGSGKTTLCERLVCEHARIERVVTSTTRKPRDGEIDGVDYDFLSNEQFDNYVAQNAFIEWAKVHTNRYGSLKSVVQGKLEENIDLVMNVDVQGVESFRQAAEENPLIGKRLVTVFIMPSDLDELRRRLRGRGKDDDEEIERRILTAIEEIERWEEYDFVIKSTSKAEDYSAICNIWRSEKLRVSRLVSNSSVAS